MSSISVITATFNSEKVIGGLIDSLVSQTDKEFDWIVADGGSTDSTLDIINSYTDDICISLIEGPDFGIYDAINKAVQKSNSEFYIVVGSDDKLNSNSIYNFRNSVDDKVSIITAYPERARLIKRFRNKFDAFSPMRKYIHGHSVYTCFRRSLHGKYGLYSRRFPIAADLLFIRKCVLGGELVKSCDFDPGFFSSEGVSNADQLGVLTETMRVQVETGVSEWSAVLVFLLRLCWSKVRSFDIFK